MMWVQFVQNGDAFFNIDLYNKVKKTEKSQDADCDMMCNSNR